MLKIPLDIQKFASGSFECTADGKLQCKVEWSSEVNGSTPAEKSVLNRSTITIKVYARRTDSSTTTGTFGGWACIENSSMQGTGSWYGVISNGYQLIYTYSNTVQHDQDGKKTVTIYGSATGPSGTSLAGRTSTGNRQITLDTIPRYAITNSVIGTNIEDIFKVNYTSYVSSWQYKLRISIPNIQLLERIDYNTSGTEFELSEETIDQLFNYFNTTNNVNLGFAVETWNGNTKLSDGNEVIITGKIVDANPIFSDFDYEDINPITLALTGDNSVNINGYSTIKAVISQLNHAEAQKRATMSKYQFRIGTQSVDIPYGYNEYEDVEGTIQNAENGIYNVYAIDSRNNATLVTKLASREIAYSSISFNSQSCKVERNNGGVGEYAVLTINGNIWNNDFGQVINSIKSLVVEYKETGSSTWLTSPTTPTATVSNNNFSFTGQVASQEQDYKFDLNKSYDFRITITDELSTATIQLTPMSSAIPNISFAYDGVGIMCDYDENLGGDLQVGGEVYVNAKKIYPKYYYSRANLTITPDNDCYCEVDGVVTTWGYGGGTVTVSISSTNNPEVVYNYNGSGRGADTASRDISAKALFKLSANVTYTISIQINNGGGETTRRLTAKTIDII